MLKTIETYLALRRATGFAMLNTEYLLKSFAAFATKRGQTHVHTQTAIDWAARGPSVAQRDAQRIGRPRPGAANASSGSHTQPRRRARGRD